MPAPDVIQADEKPFESIQYSQCLPAQWIMHARHEFVHTQDVHQVLRELLTGLACGVDRTTDKEFHDHRAAAPNDRGKNVNKP